MPRTLGLIKELAGRMALLDDEEDAGTLRFGPLVIRPHRHEVLVHGKPVELTAMDMCILELLASRPGVVFSPERIAEACHDGHAQVQSRSVNRRVQSLRKKLGEAGPCIVNMRGVGYTLRVDEDAGPTSRWWSVTGMGWLAWLSGSRGLSRLWSGHQPTWVGWAVGGVAAAVIGLAGMGAVWSGGAVVPLPWGGPSGRVVSLGSSVWTPATDPTSDLLEQMRELANWSGTGSGLAALPERDTYLVLGDRGYEDGKYDRPVMWHRMRVRLMPGSEALSIRYLEPTVLTDETGIPLRGGPADLAHRYDPEAIAVGADGRVWVGEEYGPSIDAFNASGQRVVRLTVPQHYRVAQPHADPNKEAARNTSGRVPNRGFEAIAVPRDQPTGRVYAMTQSPLIQDGGTDGRFIRLLEIDEQTSAYREWVYPLASPDHVVSEMTWVGPDRLLVLERDEQGGTTARFKRVFLVTVRGATEVTGQRMMPPNRLASSQRPVSKRLVADLLASAPRGNGHTGTYPQMEGMALTTGPRGDMLRLLITTDTGTPGVAQRQTMTVHALGLAASSLQAR